MKYLEGWPKKMGFKDEQFKWSDEQCLENYVDWNSPACEGSLLTILKKTALLD